MHAKSFSHLSVGAKIASLMGLLTLMSITLAGVALVNLTTIRADTYSLRQHAMQPIINVDHISENLLTERIMILSHASSVDDKTKNLYGDKLATARKTTDASLSEFLDGATSDEQAKIAAIQAKIDTYRDLIDSKYLPASRAGDLAKVQDYRDNQAAPQMQEIVTALSSLADAQTRRADDLVSASKASVSRTITELILFIAVSVPLGLGLGWYVTRSVRKPLSKVFEVVTALAAGDLTQRARVTTNDELGQMSQGLDRALGNVAETLGAVSSNVKSLTSEAHDLDSNATAMSASAAATADRASEVAAAASQVSVSIETVATAAEQMSSSIREIAENTSASSQVAGQAVLEAEAANETVARLGDSSKEIGEVVKLINTIAEQTNLLALNATIEAARAGDAGKGFAVVAGEVKDLAQQTARATEDIARRVEAIQADSSSAAQAISSVVTVIGRINEYQTTIASAVEEQAATTNEMSRSVAQSSSGATDIATAIVAVANAAEETSRGASSTQQIASSLSTVSGTFASLVDRFTLP